MYGMSGPELLTNLKVSDTYRDAERLHRVSEVLKERKAARYALFSLNLARFWQGIRVAKPAVPRPAS